MRHGLLPVLRGVADVVLRRRGDLGKPLLQPGDDAVGVVDAERRLREVGHLAFVGHFERGHVFGRLDQDDRLGRLAHRADHFVVPFVADEQDRVAGLGVLDRLQVDLGHERAGGVDRPQVPLAGHAADFRRNAVGGEQQRRPARHVGQVVDKRHAAAAEMLDHVLVVDDLVIDVDRRRERRQGQVERLDRHVDAGTETARTGQENLHGSMIARGRGRAGQANAVPSGYFGRRLSFLLRRFERQHGAMRRVAGFELGERLVEPSGRDPGTVSRRSGSAATRVVD